MVHGHLFRWQKRRRRGSGTCWQWRHRTSLKNWQEIHINIYSLCSLKGFFFLGGGGLAGLGVGGEDVIFELWMGNEVLYVVVNVLCVVVNFIWYPGVYVSYGMSHLTFCIIVIVNLNYWRFIKPKICHLSFHIVSFSLKNAHRLLILCT